jgi:hypothetical protein
LFYEIDVFVLNKAAITEKDVEKNWSERKNYKATKIKINLDELIFPYQTNYIHICFADRLTLRDFQL